MVAESALNGLPPHLRSAAERQQAEAAQRMRAEAEGKQARNLSQEMGLGGGDWEYEGDPGDLAELEAMQNRNVRRFPAQTSQSPATLGSAPLRTEYDGDGAGTAGMVDYEETHLGMPSYITARFLLPDGTMEEMDIEVPQMTMERIEMFSWWQHQVAQKHVALLQVGANNPKGLLQAQANSRKAKERFICYAVPEFPADRFPQLLAESFLDIVKKLDERRNAAVGQTDAPTTGGGFPNR